MPVKLINFSFSNPISFIRRSINEHELNYRAIEKELLVIV